MPVDISKHIVKIDFKSPSEIFDIHRLYVIDASDWKHLEKEEKFIGIKVPGSKNYVENYFSANRMNVYAADALGLQNPAEIDELCPLPDGIYYVKVYLCDGAEYSEERMFLRYDQLQLEIDEKVRKNYLPCSETNRDLFKDIYEYICGMKSLARMNDASGAMRLYEKVKEKVNHL
jgi:hypothetical protein